MIHIVACGGVSQVDSFDYKPELAKYHGKSLDGDEKPDVFFGKVGLLRKNDWEFKQRGQSGLWVSELFPHLASVADELTVIRSMFAETSNHTPATFQENTGFRLNGFPVVGAWTSYGLGAETDDLPAYVVIPDPRGVPAGGSINWTNGFLSARHQGVAIRSQGTPIDDIYPARPISRRRRAGLGEAARDAQRTTSSEHGRRSARGPHAQLRTGGEDAAGRARGDRSGARNGGDARGLRHRRIGDRRLRPRLPAGAAAARAGRAVRAVVFRRRVRLAAHQLGRPRKHEAKPRPRSGAHR